MRILFLFAVLATGTFYTIYALSYLAFISSSGRPGPGFFPIIIGTGIVALTLTCFVEDIRRIIKSRDKLRFDQGNLPYGVIFIVLMGLAYVSMLRYLGGVVSSIVFLLITFSVLNPGRNIQNVMVAAGVPLAIYVLFRQLLNASMPQGLLSIPF